MLTPAAEYWPCVFFEDRLSKETDGYNGTLPPHYCDLILGLANERVFPITFLLEAVQYRMGSSPVSTPVLFTLAFQFCSQW